MNRIMLDLETLGHRPGSVIVAIGAVRFGGGEIHDRFYSRIDPGSCEEIGLKMDAGTVAWWMNKSEEARKVFEPGASSIMDALVGFAWWTGGHGTPKEIWGNGATFDNVLLAEAYAHAKVVRPWSYKEDRCYRTMCALRPDVPFVPVGVHHNAVDDAESQALHLMKIEEAIGKGRTTEFVFHSGGLTVESGDTSPRPSPHAAHAEREENGGEGADRGSTASSTQANRPTGNGGVR